LDQPAFTHATLHQLTLALTATKSDRTPAPERQDGDIVTAFKRQNPSVVGDRRVATKSRTTVAVTFESRCDYGDGSDSHLGGKPKARSHLSVVTTLE